MYASRERPSLDHPSGLRVPAAHLFSIDDETFLLNVESGKIFELKDPWAQAIESAIACLDEDRVRLLMSAAKLDSSVSVPEAPPSSVRVRALSLAVAQKCNLSCTYCYAHQGDFGGPATSMSLDVAKASVDRLIADATRGESVSLAFMGGEPLLNRDVLQAATDYAAKMASAAGIKISFSITTNGTLLEPRDAEFFDRFGFDATISIDGVREAHNRLRVFNSGRGSYDQIIERAQHLLRRPQRSSIVRARVTVTPKNLNLRETVDELIRLGFDGVQLSPALSSPNGQDILGNEELDILLARMIECGQAFEEHVLAGKQYPFSNMISMLRRIHHYILDTYPCGAGGGYMGVSSDGGLFACHRFVGDAQRGMGNVVDGVDPERQSKWLAERHVLRQEPCRQCWARYLCGGGCHHEEIHRGRPACDFIRGWVHYCLGAYVRLLKAQSKVFPSLLNAEVARSDVLRAAPIRS